MSVRALNLYYAREPAIRDQVLATRLRATDVREAIGITRGRVFSRTGSDGDYPDVMWDCPFADAGAHDRDMQARAASAEFESCRALMRTLTRRFERVLYRVESGADSIAAAPGGVVQCWVQSLAPGIVHATQLAEPQWLRVKSPAAVLRRMDANAGVPDWIIEVPAERREALASAIQSWITARSPFEFAALEFERVA